MGLDLWFREDVARILASTHETMTAAMDAATPLSPEVADAYQQGFADAIKALAVAFGVCPPGNGSRPVRTRPRGLPAGATIYDKGARL